MVLKILFLHKNNFIVKLMFKTFGLLFIILNKNDLGYLLHQLKIMRLCHKIPLLLQLYTFDVNMPEDGMYELTLISKKDGSFHTFQDKTWGKVVHLAFMFMNKMMRQEAKNELL